MRWTDAEVVVPTVIGAPGRADSVRELLLDLSRQCPGVLVRLAPQEQREKGDWRPAFEAISGLLAGVSRPWVVYVEDDVVLARDFGAGVPAALRSVGDECGVVSFFSCQAGEPKMLERGVRFYPANRPFTHLQCAAIRRDVALHWQRRLLRWWDAAPQGRHTAPDIALGDCCDEVGAEILVHLPSLVQHRELPSVFGHSRCPKSPTFRHAGLAA